VTVNFGCYIYMPHNFLTPEIKRRGINQQTVCFQQDGDTAHTVRASMAVVLDMFSGQVTSQSDDLPETV
jgi:hypothetical protein